MPILDFKEIPQANLGSGEQDKFELFARDFFQVLGYEVSRGPARGPDGGCDLILTEERIGISKITSIKWLVSCKHKAHSGSSVLLKDEPDISDSVASNGCSGFIGFYSTIPASGLQRKIESLTKIDWQLFDSESIESALLDSAIGLKVAERYFPNSYLNWKSENPVRAEIYDGLTGIQCIECGVELAETRSGNYVQWEKIEYNEDGTRERYIDEIYCCCKGSCDKSAQAHRRETPYFDKWDDLRDIMIPSHFIKHVMSLLNEIQAGDVYSKAAFAEEKRILLEVYPYVSRSLTTSELERMRILLMIPPGV